MGLLVVGFDLFGDEGTPVDELMSCCRSWGYVSFLCCCLFFSFAPGFPFISFLSGSLIGARAPAGV